MKKIMTIAFCVAGLCAGAQNTKPVLTIVTPFVLYGEISDYNLIRKLRDSLFDTYIVPSAYKRSGSNEKEQHDFAIKVYKKYLKKYYDLNFLKVSADDSTTMADELKKMKIKKNEPADGTAVASSSIDKMFSKYSRKDTLFMMTSVTDYYLKGAFSGHRSKAVAWTLLEVYVIDAENRKVIFYNNKINKWLGGPGGMIPADFKKTLKGFVKKTA